MYYSVLVLKHEQLCPKKNTKSKVSQVAPFYRIFPKKIPYKNEGRGTLSDLGSPACEDAATLARYS